MSRCIILFILTALNFTAFAQEEADTNGYLPNVMIDSVVVKSNKLDVPTFIKMIKNDTSFYKAFRNMRFETYNTIQEFKAYDKKGRKIVATQNMESKQIFRDGCRTTKVLEENTSGDFYNNKGDFNYYTAEMFSSLFHTKGKICKENRNVTNELRFSANGKSGLAKRRAQLKQLIFNPGSRVDDIPFFGKKSSIFTQEMMDKYEYKITDEEKNGEFCYKFDATPLPQFKNQVVINRIVTWFRKSDYAIISRTYNLSYHGFGYDFDVVMLVDLKSVNGTLLPTYINYDGNWHITAQGREKVKFKANFYY